MLYRGRIIEVEFYFFHFYSQEYMSRLKQIRLNNFNERRMQQAKENAAPAYKVCDI